MGSIILVVDALKWAFKTFGDNLVLYLKLFVLSSLIVLVSILIFFTVIIMVLPDEAVTTFDVAPLQVMGALWLYVVPFYLTLGYIKIALFLYEGRPVISVKQFFVSWRLFAKSFIALCLYSLLCLLGLVCFIIPGLIIASFFYYIIYCIMSDDAGIIESFTCSLRLTKTLPMHALLLLASATALGAVWFLLPVAALMNVYAYKQRQNSITYDA